VTRVTGGSCRLAQTRRAGKHILNGGGRPALTSGRRGNDGRHFPLIEASAGLITVLLVVSTRPGC